MPPPGDISLDITGNLEPLISEFQRVMRLARETAGQIDFSRPFDVAAASARRAQGVFQQVFQGADLSLQNMERSAEDVNKTFIEQQRQLKLIEAQIRQIQNLPIVNERQYRTLVELEKIQTRLSSNMAGAAFPAPGFAQGQVSIARFRSELEGVAKAQEQVRSIGRDINAILTSRVGVDPRLVETLREFQDTLIVTGPAADAVFNTLKRGTADTIAGLTSTNRGMQDLLTAQRLRTTELNKEDAAAARLIRTNERLTNLQRDLDKFATQRSAELRAQITLLQERLRLQQEIAALPPTPAGGAIPPQVTALQGLGGPVRKAEIQEVQSSVALLKKEMASTIPVVEAMDTSFDKAFSQFVRYAKITALFTLAYQALRVAMSSVEHIVELDSAIRNVSTTLETNAEKARVLPAAYKLIETGMTQYGLSTKEAGQLTLELARSLDGNVQLMQAAYLPALALTTTGEVNMTEAARVLIGTVNSFGLALTGALTPMQSYTTVSDKILRASDLSVGSIQTFSQALTFVASRASAAGVTLNETLALLSLIQDSLGRASQSGTGLARVFEGMVLKADQLAAVFNVKFDPTKPLKTMDLLRGVMEKLREEFVKTGRISQETAQKIQQFIGTEQGTRQIELLIRQFPKLEARIAAMATASERTQRQLDEHNKKIATSYTNMANQVLISIEKVIASIDKAFGGDAGTPGQYSAIARALQGIGDTFEGIGNTADNVGTAIGNVVNGLSALIQNVLTLGGLLPAIPPPPQWMLDLLDKLPGMMRVGAGTLAGAAVGTAVAGPVGTIPGALAGALSGALTNIGIEAAKARKELEALQKAQKSLGEQRAGERQEIANPVEEAANQAAITAETIARRRQQVAQMEAESAREIDKRNAELAITERIARAEQDLAISRAEYAKAKEQYQAKSNLGKQNEVEGLAELQRIQGKMANDETELNALRARQRKERQVAYEKETAEIEKQREVVRKLQTDIDEVSAPKGPFAQIDAKEQADFEDRMAKITKDHGEKFAESVRDLVLRLQNVKVTAGYDKIYEGLVKPYRDGTTEAINQLDELIYKTDQALGAMDLSAERRREIADTPGRMAGALPFLNVEKARNELRALEAQFGLFGEEARQAAFAAAAGFSSFSDLVEEADLRLQYLGKRGLKEALEQFEKLRRFEIGAVVQKAANDLADAQRQLDIAFSEVGASPEKIAASAQAWGAFKQSFDEIAASADPAKRQVAGFFLELAKINTTTAFVKSATAEIRNVERATLGATEAAQLFGADAIAAGLAAETWGLKVSELDERQKALVKTLAEARQKQKELADSSALQGIGGSPAESAALAHQLALIDERNKKIADGAAVLARLNRATETSFQNQIELAKESARATGDFIKFFELSFAQAATQGHDFWTDFETMARNTAQAATSALSDGFFAILTGNLEDAKAAFKNFFNAILRELSNFMASQLVSQFVRLFSAGGGDLGLRGGSGSLSDQIRGRSSPGIDDPLGEGMITSGSTIGGGGVDWSGAANSVGAFVSGLQIATAKTSIFGATLSGISTGWKVGEGLIGGISGAAQGGWQAFSSAMLAAEGLTVALAGVGAAVAAFGSIMDIAGDQVEAGIGGLVGGAIGAVALGYFFPGIGHFLGYVIGDLIGSLIGGLFGGGPSNYEKKRQEAAEEANEAFNTLSQTYKDAAKSGDPNTVLGALRTGGGGAAGNSVRTNLTLSPELASRLGITGDIVGERVIAQWANITPEQFARLLAAYTTDPGLIESTIAGSGDVPYLEGEDAQGVADAARQIGVNLLKAFVAFAEVRKKVDELSDALIESAKDYLSPGTAAAFAENIVAPIREQIIAATTSGLGIEEMTTKLKGLQATLQAYVSLVGLYSQLTAQHAGLSADYAKTLELEAKTVATARKALDKQIQSAVKGLGVEGGVVDQIFAGGTVDFSVLQEEITNALSSLTPELAFDKLKALNDAVLARYDFEKNLILGIEAEIGKLYEGFFDSILRLGQVLGEIQVDVDGTSSYFGDFIRVLGTIATTTLSVSEAIYLATATLNAALSSLPARISGQGGSTGTTPGPGAGGLGLNEIFPAVLEGLDPFIRTINAQITSALAAGDYEAVLQLQEQLADGIVQAYNAAIAGVRQWEQEQLDAIEETRRAAVEGYEAQRDAALDLLEAQADGIQAQLDGIDAQKFAIQQQQWAIEDAIYAAEQALKPLEDSLEAIEDQQKAIERSLIRPLERAIRGLEQLMDPIQDQLDGYQDQIDAINEAQDDQLWNIRLQQRELEDQRDVIQDQIDLIEEWSQAVEELAKFIEDLALGDLAPPDLFGQFNIAQTKLADLFAEFFENPEAGDIGEIQDMVQTVLGLAADLFGQPSTEYQEFFRQIMDQLGLVMDIAGAEGGDPTELEDLEEQLEHVNEQLDTLSDLTDDIQWANEQQIHAIEELMEPLEDALDEYQRQIDLLQEQIDLHQEAVEDLEEIAEGIQDQLEDGRDAIEVLRDQAAVLSRAEQILGRQETILNRDLSGIRKAQEEVRDKFQKLIDDANENAKTLTKQVGDAAQAQINWIRDNMRPIIEQAQISNTAMYEFLRDHHYERLMDFTLGRGSAAWMKQATTDTQAFTGAIMNALDRFLSGELVPAVRISEAAGSTEERLIGTLNSLDITLGNLDSTLQGVNAVLAQGGTGVPYQDPYGGAPPPSAAIGARYVHDGIYRLHEGEMVVPRAPAEALRSMSTGWHDISARDSSLNVNIGSVVIQAAPGDNGDALYGRFLTRLESDIRSGGRMRSVIQRAVN